MNMSNPETVMTGNSRYELFFPSDFSMATVMEISPLDMSLEIGAGNLKSTADYSTAIL